MGPGGELLPAHGDGKRDVGAIRTVLQTTVSNKHHKIQLRALMMLVA